MSKKRVLMVMPVLKGGGAERVASILTNEFYRDGYDCEFLLTSSSADGVVSSGLDEAIPLLSLRDFFKKSFTDILYKLLRMVSSVLCKPFEKLKKTTPVAFAYISFIANYHKEIKAFKNILKDRPEATVIAFLQPSIPIVLLASKGLPNKVIISERGDSNRLMKHRYGYKFIKKYYERADVAVFQTEDAKNTYPQNIARKGTVIFNPIKNNLPESYSGERNKNITTFCRISPEKNLEMLINAYKSLLRRFPEYRLRIIGDALNEAEKKYFLKIKDYINSAELSDMVDLLPFSLNVHELVVKDAVYVNSSNHEGMSNAMLEAMAIGLPVVCTDCPIGGAAAIIKNGENGLLIPVGDAQSLADAIERIITDNELSSRLSRNATKLREELSLTNIAKKWMELL